MTMIEEAPGSLLERLRSKDRDGNRWYEYPPTGENYISVTAVHRATEGKPHLIPWAGMRSATRCVDNLPMIAQMLADKGRDATLEYLAEDAERDRDMKADTGTYVHDIVEALTLWTASPEGTGRDIILPSLPDKLAGADYDGLPVENVSEWMVDGFLNFVSDWSPQFEAAEMPVFHNGLRYAGTLDLIVTLAGYAIDHERSIFAESPGSTLTVCLDVKTGKHQSPTWREQVAAYRRADECVPDDTSGMQPMPATDCAAVLHLRPEYGAKCYRLMLVSGANDAQAWQTFQHALITFQDRDAAKAKPGRVVYPIGPDGKIPAPLLADLDGEGYGRMLSPLMKAGVVRLDDLASFTAAEIRELKGIGPKTVVNARALLAEYGLCFAGEVLAEVA